MLTLRTSLDMTPGSRNRVEIPVSQYDTAVSLVFTLYASTDAGFTIPSGTTASVRGTKVDGHGVSKTASITGNVVTVELDEQMTAVAGRNLFEVVLESNGKKLSSQNFVLVVERAAMDKDTLVSGSEIRELVNIVDRTDEIIAAGTQADEAKDAIEEAEASLRTIQQSVAQNAAQVAADKQAVAAAEARIAPAVADGVDAVNAEYTHHVQVIQQGTEDLNNLATQLKGEIRNTATDGTTAITAYKNDALLAIEHAFDDAMDAAEGVETAARQATTSAQNASTSAQNASSSAQQATTSAQQAATSAQQADTSAGDSEAYAIGTRDGVAVASTDPAYNNNAKYWAEHSGGDCLASEFSTSASYSAGDYVLHDHRLYRFTTAHAAGAWNSSQVTEVKVGGELSDLKGDLNEILEQGILAHFAVDDNGYICQRVEVV